jgi:hypothetical protein
MIQWTDKPLSLCVSGFAAIFNEANYSNGMDATAGFMVEVAMLFRQILRCKVG